MELIFVAPRLKTVHNGLAKATRQGRFQRANIWLPDAGAVGHALDSIDDRTGLRRGKGHRPLPQTTHLSGPARLAQPALDPGRYGALSLAHHRRDSANYRVGLFRFGLTWLCRFHSIGDLLQVTFSADG